MEVKPIPKPRTVIMAPVPAPRNLQVPQPPPRSTSPSGSSNSDKSDEAKPNAEVKNSTPEFFRSLSNSSKHFKDEFSEKMTVKGKAVISSTRNASIRLEKSMKSLLTRRLTTVGGDCEDTMDGKIKGNNEDDRCVSMPAHDVFSGISFYSPLHANLRSIPNEEDLPGARYSPPPPVYPPPPLPDESIYDELQSVTSGHSSRYDTLSSSVSELVDRDFPASLDLLSFVQSRRSDSDQSLNLSDVNVSEKFDSSKKLSRSDSWTFYDTIPGRTEKTDAGEELDATSSTEELESEPPIRERILSDISQLSLPNSLYEKWYPRKPTSPVADIRMSPADRQQSKSLLYEFDPLAKADENIYSNYENNDLMLLEALLATSESPSSAGSMADLCEEDEIGAEEEVMEAPGLTESPPNPPRRFDSLPKNEYDEVEVLEVRENASSRNPALLPKSAQLNKGKQPAVPPRKPTIKIHIDTLNAIADSAAPTNLEEVPPPSPKTAEETRSTMMQRLQKKLRNDATALGRPTVMNFMRNTKLLSRNRDPQRETPSRKATRMERPKYTGHNMSTHRGVVFRPGVGLERTKDLVPRVAVLQENKLSFYTDKNMTTLKEAVSLESIHSVHLLQHVKTVDGETVHCIAVSGEGRPGVHVFYAKGVTERRIWAQHILEALTPVFPIKYTAELTSVGWAYLKEGVTGAWFPAWLLLQQRTLVYTRHMEPVVFEHLDLRKARYIVVRDQEGPGNVGNMPVIVVDAGGRAALHVAAPGTRETPAWRHALHQAATNCGPTLDQQQLTQDNVPVALDKCINFIYAHGIMSEGIYRRSGSSTAVVRLLEAFRRDAWATQITRVEYSEHDVATVLRRFLRDFPESLFPPKMHEALCRVPTIPSEDEKVTIYRRLLGVLNPVASATLRRILAHLHCLSQQSARNLMNVENLSAVWGPTLMNASGSNAEEWNRSETKVVGDLIQLYPKLYQLSAGDLAREAKILEVLERHHVSNNRPRGAPSGDLKVWIYIMARDEECVSVTIGPHKTAFDVCKELAGKTKHPPHELCLEESALGGALERPLHHNEKVLETVARWGYWDTDDRKDNVLVLKKNGIYRDIVPLVKPPMTKSGELKFADTKTKHFKSYLFEFSQAKLCCYKDKVCSTKLHEWRIEDIVWYLGHEPKRNPQMGWSITFIIKNNKPTRCKENPFFGNTLAGTSKDDEYRWLAAMLFGEYQLDLRPSAVNLMDA